MYASVDTCQAIGMCFQMRKVYFSYTQVEMELITDDLRPANSPLEYTLTYWFVLFFHCQYWNRLSSLQRSVICIVLILGTVSIIYLYPNLFSSGEEVDNFSRKRQVSCVTQKGPDFSKKKKEKNKIKSKKSVSYQKKYGRGPTCPSFFWYDNDSGH